jgi:TPR repeat protein
MKKRLVSKILTSLLVVLLGVNTLDLPVTHATPTKKTTIKQAPQLMVAMPVKKPIQPTKFDKLLSSAEQGNADAQVAVGFIYRTAQWGIQQDYKKALYWYQKSAEQNNPKAQFQLGVVYERGEGLPKDYKKAIYWFQKSAEQGDEGSQAWLGHMYDNGQGVPQDYQQANYWYQKSAEQGNLLAQYGLGLMYGQGKGIMQDHQKAYLWLSLAASQDGIKGTSITENAASARNFAATLLTPAQLTQAQQWARGWHEKIQAKKAQTSEQRKKGL